MIFLKGIIEPRINAQDGKVITRKLLETDYSNSCWVLMLSVNPEYQI